MEEDTVFDRVQRKKVHLTARFPMYPFHERKLVNDPYGQPIDLQDYREIPQQPIKEEVVAFPQLNSVPQTQTCTMDFLDRLTCGYRRTEIFNFDAFVLSLNLLSVNTY